MESKISNVSTKEPERLITAQVDQFQANHDIAIAISNSILNSFPKNKANERLYPESFGGMYIGDDGKLVIQRVRGSDGCAGITDIIRADDGYLAIGNAGGASFEYVDYSYSRLLGVYNAVVSYMNDNLNATENLVISNLDSVGIIATSNKVNVYLLDVSPQQIIFFKEAVVDHPSLAFVQTTGTTLEASEFMSTDEITESNTFANATEIESLYYKAMNTFVQNGFSITQRFHSHPIEGSCVTMLHEGKSRVDMVSEGRILSANHAFRSAELGIVQSVLAGYVVSPGDGSGVVISGGASGRMATRMLAGTHIGNSVGNSVFTPLPVAQTRMSINPYDVNRDGRVDAQDLNIVSHFTGLTDNDPNWTAFVQFPDGTFSSPQRCDVDENGEIDMLDLMLVLFNYTPTPTPSPHSNGTLNHGSITLRYIKTSPNAVELFYLNPVSTLSASNLNGMNAGFFNNSQGGNPQDLVSIAVIDDLPVGGPQWAHGSGWFNGNQASPIARGTLVWDWISEQFSIQVLGDASNITASLGTFGISPRKKYWAQGGISMSLHLTESAWLTQIGSSGERWGDIYSSALRTGLLYDNDKNLWLVATANSITAPQFRTAIINGIGNITSLVNGIFLDGGGSTQQRYNGSNIISSSRNIPQIIRLK